MSPALDVGFRSICSIGALAAHAPNDMRSLAPGRFSLAFMAGFIELACEEAIRPYLGESERSYGAALRLSRRSVAPALGEVTISTEIVGMAGGRIGFRFECRDERGALSAGYHERMVVSGAAAGAGRRVDAEAV